MATSWITLYPDWYIHECKLLARHYPQFQVDQARLLAGVLQLYGDLAIRPPGGSVRHPVKVEYPEATPYEHPCVTPLQLLPEWTEDGTLVKEPETRWFDHRHQMPGGGLCLFQRETRGIPGGDVLDIVSILQRAEAWFLGHHTGRWPPDTAQSELESHFVCVADVLIAETFYRLELDGFGRMFLVYDFKRCLSPNYPGSGPFILTALTNETVAIQTFDARTELARLYPWIEGDHWDATRLSATPDLSVIGQQLLKHGYWWSLPHEPRPFHDGSGLLRELASVAESGDAWAIVSGLLKGDATLANHHFIGLRYPARRGGREWLILFMPRKVPKSRGGAVLIKDENAKRKAFEGAPIHVVRAHRVQPEVLRLRNRGVVDDTVITKTVALIGLGALGSQVAELLAKAGVGRFRLCDSDCLTTGNVSRHVAGINDFGARKTDAVMARLLEINPYLEFSDDDVIAGSATESLDRLRAFMDGTDLTVCTTADEGAESVINQVAVLGKYPVLYGRSIRRASMGRVFLVRPGRDACKACLGYHLKTGRDGGDTPDDWIDVPEEQDGVLLHECGRPVIAGSAIDLSFIAALIARIALDLLEGKETDSNHWLWSRLPASDVDPRLASPMSTFVGRLPRRKGCPACQEPEIVELVMTDEVKQAIISMAKSSPDAETGGLLIGFVDERNRAIAVRATEPGPKAERSPTRFRRDVEYVQAQLDHAAADLGPKGAYLGEWHSHLIADTQPGPLDIESLFGISQAPNYLTRCPVLIIAGLDPSANQVAAVSSWVFPIGGRIYGIPSETVSRDVALGFQPAPLNL